MRYVNSSIICGRVRSNVHKAMSSPFHFVETQEDDEDIGQRASVSLAKKSPIQVQPPRTAKPENFAALRSSPSVAAAIPKSPQSVRLGIKTTPKARLRHEDSQIRFAAIESSPLAPEAVESQYLTDRQKEVKERQGRDVAAMFPEIRSSPRSASRPVEYSLPKLVFKSTQNQPLESAADDENSPMFPPDILMNDFLGSSPTPSSSKKGSNNLQSDDGPPSSPPFVPSHLTIFKKAAPALAQGDEVGATDKETDQCGNVVEEKPVASTDGLPTGAQEAVDQESQKPATREERASVAEARPTPSNQHLLSDFDVYVDAPSEPTTSQPAVEEAENEVSHVTSSFHSQESSRYETEDDQVTAQLIHEMERASSQQSQTLQAITKPASKLTKTARKRKSMFDLPPKANKKAKRTSASSFPEQIAEAPHAGETVADCVMIDVRDAPCNHAFTPVQIKKENSPSPSFITASQFAEETSHTKKGRGRPRGRSRANRLSRGDSATRTSPRQSRVKVEQDQDFGMLPTPPAQNTRSSKSHRKSALGSQQRKSIEGSHDHNSELDTDPLAPNADHDNSQAPMEGINASDIPQAQLKHRQRIASKQPEAPLADAHTENRAPEADNVAETRGLIPTPQGILRGFKDMLANVKRVALGPEEERAMVGVLFESVKEVHEAGRRNAAT
jgi:hypothetical protein